MNNIFRRGYFEFTVADENNPRKRWITGEIEVSNFITPNEVHLALENNERIIQHKVGLLILAEELRNVFRACKTIGLSRARPISRQ